MVELEAAIVRLEDERSGDRVELTVSDATVDAARARIAELEHLTSTLTQRVAMTERERDSRHMTDERDRLGAELQARDRRIVEIEAALDEGNRKVQQFEARLGTLTRARTRLFDASLQAAEERTKLEASVEAGTQEIARLEAERLDLTAAVAAAYDESADQIRRLKSRSAKLEYDFELASARFALLKTKSEHAKGRNLPETAGFNVAPDAELARANGELENQAQVVRTLMFAQCRAAETIADLQLAVVRLEHDIATRISLLEANASRAALETARLRADRTLLFDTIALRERRIATLEAILREIAHEMIGAAEAERDRYLALHNGLLQSKIVKLRDALRNLASRPLALRARIFAKSARTARRRRPKSSDKRTRHLRSA